MSGSLLQYQDNLRLYINTQNLGGNAPRAPGGEVAPHAVLLPLTDRCPSPTATPHRSYPSPTAAPHRPLPLVSPTDFPHRPTAHTVTFSPSPPSGGPFLPASPHPAQHQRSPSRGKLRAPARLPPRLCSGCARGASLHNIWPHMLSLGEAPCTGTFTPAGVSTWRILPCLLQHGQEKPRPHT